MVGFEPTISCSQSRRVNHFPTPVWWSTRTALTSAPCEPRLAHVPEYGRWDSNPHSRDFESRRYPSSLHSRTYDSTTLPCEVQLLVLSDLSEDLVQTLSGILLVFLLVRLSDFLVHARFKPNTFFRSQVFVFAHVFIVPDEERIGNPESDSDRSHPLRRRTFARSGSFPAKHTNRKEASRLASV